MYLCLACVWIEIDQNQTSRFRSLFLEHIEGFACILFSPRRNFDQVIWRFDQREPGIFLLNYCAIGVSKVHALHNFLDLFSFQFISVFHIMDILAFKPKYIRLLVGSTIPASGNVAAIHIMFESSQ
jgi:hypothetical protein